MASAADTLRPRISVILNPPKQLQVDVIILDQRHLKLSQVIMLMLNCELTADWSVLVQQGEPTVSVVPSGLGFF